MTDAADAPTPVRDFTKRREPLRFRIGDDEFAAPPILGGYTLKELANLHASLGDQLTTKPDEAVEAIGLMFGLLLPGPSGRLFTRRLLSEGRPADPELGFEGDPEPISLTDEAVPVLFWLLECYGLRPTGPSSPSPDGSTDGQTASPSAGASSTDGASDTESTTAA